MPELPEVETIRRGLKNATLNKKFIKIKVNLPRLIKIPKSNEFKNRLKDSFVKDITRRGKYISFLLNTTDYLIIHLGMSGRLIYQGKKLPLFKTDEKHNHLFFFFEDGSKMIYHDVRQFGKIWLLKKDEKLSCIETLGFEPLEYHFTLKEFYLMLQRNKRSIKSLLMDQKSIAGIGNIYANEILFHSGIHPLRKAHSLKKNEAKRVYFSIRDILSKAIELRGTTMIDESYRDSQGNKGEYGKIIMVYGKKGGICPFCGQPLEVIRIENRSTFMCSACQI